METTLKKLAEMYSDSRLSPGEVTEFNKLTERAVVDLLQLEGDEGVSNALCKSFEVTNQLVQTSLLRVRKNEIGDDVKKALANAIYAQMELLKANIVLFSE